MKRSLGRPWAGYRAAKRGLFEVPIFFGLREGSIVPREEWRAWDGPRAIGETSFPTVTIRERLPAPLDFRRL